MRIGQNPAKFISHVTQPQKVTVAVITYVPFLGGYYEEGLDLLKVCLGSLRQNTSLAYDLMVFDNASCTEVRSYLLNNLDQGKIQYLLLSKENIGKAGAWNFIFSAAPGEYLAYADYDIYFYAGWLEHQLSILEKLPQVGMVTGMPVRCPLKYSTSTIRWAEAQSDVKLERGCLMPWEDFWKHTQSLGLSETQARKSFSNGEDVCLTHQDNKYYIGAAHFQFVSRTEVLKRVVPIPSRRPMGEVRLLDIAIDKMGYLRLSTLDWWVQHLGNTVPSWLGKVPDEIQQHKKASQRFSLWKLRLVRKFINWIYNKSFQTLYKN